MAKFRIDHSDPAYPKIVRDKGQDAPDGIIRFNTLGEAKQVLLNELVSMKSHYQGLIDDVRKTTIKQVDDISYPHILD